MLSWWQGNVTATGEINTGEDVVVNQHYQTVATLRGKNGWVLTLHEMKISGHDAWVTANKNVPTNLSNYGGVNNGVLVDSAIQEYDLRTGKLVYTWKASDHIPLSESKTQPPTNGFGYDAYHVNAVQLLGKRQVARVDAQHVGDLHDRHQVPARSCGRSAASTRASRSQHAPLRVAARRQMLNGNTLTMFDDHCCYITGAGVYLSATGPSRGLVLRLNFHDHTVKRVAQYSHGSPSSPLHGQHADPARTASGSSAGARRRSSRCTPDRASCSSTRRCRPRTCPTGPMSRLGRHAAVSAERRRRRASGHTTVYASWNGATRLTRWKVLAVVPGKAPRVVAEKSKSGFETAIPVGGDHSRFEVQALDSTGQVIGTSRQFGIS